MQPGRRKASDIFVVLDGIVTEIVRSTVVFITSNFQGNSEIMEGCKEAGIPAFGTLWDF